MKIIAIFCLSLILSSCATRTSRSKSLNFKTVYKVDFESIKEEAKKSNKLIFIDVFATWCGPCKYMDQTAFKDPILIEKFEKGFINYKVDAEDFDGINIAQKYQIAAYPTYLFLNADGTLISRFEGSCAPEKLIKYAENSLTKILY